jgi:hypothetical protein
MEADWEIEIGGGAPIIEARWPGLVDLRLRPEHARLISETHQLYGLSDALVLMNAPASPVWTSKCDVFVPAAIDPYELDAPHGSALHALACYIDVLPKNEQGWASIKIAESVCRIICNRLRGMTIRSCRADLVIRRALLADEAESLGVTAYITAAAEDDSSAANQLSAALAAFADAVGAPTPESAS